MTTKRHHAIILDNVDVPLLRRQKQALLRAIRKADVNDTLLLDGVLNLLDHIHDTIDPPTIMKVHTHAR